MTEPISAVPTHDDVIAQGWREKARGPWCLRCGWPFRLSELTADMRHTTFYEMAEIPWPARLWVLCESCWALLGGPEERWPYYRYRLEETGPFSTETWLAVLAAVVSEG